ncbi:hypothetical protein ACFYOG_30565 [Streptomyces sp. NPDC007818]|uniref:hypothetical protein n=1 Tax=Streptomyces sp. NPDC007818 TaxID=3364780 RepID=UPI0036AF6FF6
MTVVPPYTWMAKPYRSPPMALYTAAANVPTRLDPPPPPRKLHLIHRLHITPELRATLAETEQDELPDGSDEISVIERIDYRETSGLTVPPIGPALAAPPQPRAAVTDVALEAVTDHCTGE